MTRHLRMWPRSAAWEAEAVATSVRRAVAVPGRERDTAVQALKAAGAAVLAWAVAGWWWQAPMALMAPWTAVALVQGTVYRSVRTGAQQLVLITAGTLLAAGAAVLTGNQMAAMALALPPAALLGTYTRFGDQAVYAPATVVFVLTYGSYSGADILHRLAEAGVGAVIGIAVNALLLPPVHLRDVQQSLAGLGRDCAQLLREMADDIEKGYDSEDAARWQNRADRLTASLQSLHNARLWNRESYRFNPGRRMRRNVGPPPPLEHDTYWERFTSRLTGLVGLLADQAGEDRRLAAAPDAALSCLAELLRAVATVCETDRDRRLHPPGPGEDSDDEERAAAGARARSALDGLKRVMTAEGSEQWLAVGALVAEAQRLIRLAAPDGAVAARESS